MFVRFVLLLAFGAVSLRAEADVNCLVAYVDLRPIPILKTNFVRDRVKLEGSDGFIGENNAGLHRAQVNGVDTFVKWLDLRKVSTWNEVFLTSYLGTMGLGPQFHGVLLKGSKIGVVTDYLKGPEHFLGLTTADRSLMLASKKRYQDATQRFHQLKALGIKPSDTQGRYDSRQILRLVDYGFYEITSPDLNLLALEAVRDLEQRLAETRQKRKGFAKE